MNYTCDFNPSGCGADWDNNGFEDYESATWGCDGDYSIYDNVWQNQWSSDATLLAYNGTSITGHQGGDITISFQVLRQ